MEHLYKEIDKKGNNFLDTLFSKPLKISEKIDGTALIAKKMKNGNITFFGREGTKRIDKMTRMFSTMYDPGIEYLKKQNLSFMRTGEELHFEYFAPKVQHIVTYNKVPDHGLVLLSSTTSRNIQNLAKDLGVLPPPVIFQGKLDSKQKEELTKFLLMSPELRAIKAKTNSFTRFIINLLNPKYDAILGNYELEGIVISTTDGNYNSKIVDPLFTDRIMSKKENDQIKSAYFKLVSSLIVDMDIDHIDDFEFSSDDPEDQYIEFMFYLIDVNLPYLMKRRDDFKEYDYGRPYVVTYTEFNYNMFPPVISGMMKEHPWFRDFARLLFSNLTKEKKRATKNFSREDVQNINNKVRKIKSMIDIASLEESIDEVQIDEAVQTFGVMFGRYQPLTVGHMKGIEQMAKQVDKGTVYIVKGKQTSKNKDSNPFDAELQIKLLKSAVPRNIDVEIAPTAFFPDIINEIDADNFKVFAGTDRVDSYKKMLKWVAEEKEAEVVEIKREGLASGQDVSATKVRKALKDDDKKSFEKMTPKSVHKFYDELRKYV